MRNPTENPRTDAISPPLKWAGGKRWQIPHLAPIWEKHRDCRLVEPFCGGLAVALGLKPERALLNDINPHVINFYQWLKGGLEVSIPMKNEKEFYYQHRDLFNKRQTNGGKKSREAAALFYYLNRTGYNGLCRFNSKGIFNVPFGRYKTINYIRDFSRYRNPFSRWTFKSQDFGKLRVKADDFIYADPPYDVEFTSYSAGGFSWDDQVRTAELLAGHPGPTVLSNQATRRIVRLYRKLGFKLRYLDAPRRISCTGDRTPAREVLAVKNI